MNQTEFCRQMGWSRKDFAPLRPVWRMSASRQNEVVPWYEESFIRQWAGVMKPSDELLEQMIGAGRTGASTPAGRIFGWLLHHAVYRQGPVLPIGGLPLPEKAFGDQAGLLQLLAALGAFPMIVESMTGAGLPRHYAEACGGWLAGTVTIFRAAHNGVPGHSINQLFWMRCYIDLQVFRIGRLEFEPKEYPDFLPVVCRNRITGRVTALARNRSWFMPDGSPAGAFAPGAVQVQLCNADGVLRGTPIDPTTGNARLGEPVELPLTEWENVNSAGEQAVSVHIPGGGGMTPEAVRESLREAAVFFRKYFGFAPKLWYCYSWLLNPDWERLIPDTNIGQFARAGYRCAMPGGGRDGMFFIFGRSDGDTAAYPARNRLEKAFHQIWDEGRLLRSGVMFILTADLDDLKPDLYRRPL